MSWRPFVIIISIFGISLSAFSVTPEGPRWPQTYDVSSGRKLTVFQPQGESLKDNILKVRSAIRIQEGKSESFGSAAMQTQVLVSKDQNLVTLSNVKVTEIKIPTKESLEPDVKKDLEKALGKTSVEIPYQTLIKNLEMNDSDLKKTSVAIQNTPPKFIFASKPSLLIMVDGAPKWVPSDGAKEVERIINTSALILHEKDKPYYLWALGKWFTSNQELGQYTPGKSPSSKYVMIKDKLVKDKKVDPLAGKTSDGKNIYPSGVNPQIYIATAPTELLQSNGDPQYQPIQGTSLLYMSNSSNSIFLDTKTNQYYVLVSGRWFKNAGLSGSWSYVPGKDLPGDFKKIPISSPVAEVLVSVPGTAQSKEAVIASQIPQTAKVARDLKPEKIVCDKNTYEWTPINETSLNYARNCNTPLIEVNDKMFYLVQNGVWFSSSAPGGPWSVAVAVPAEIYKIPASSPLYYVTYVHIYSVANDSVTVGYTPGYNGTFVSSDGTIVYGTGYNYNSYYSDTTWYPSSPTYGFGVGYGWYYGSGFFMGYAMGSMMYPWGWGSCCWGGNYVNVNVTNVYHNWGKTSVVTGPAGRGFRVNTVGQAKFARGIDSDMVYTRKDGEVYRRTGKNDWQKYDGPGTWSDVSKNSNLRGELDNQHAANRDLGAHDFNRSEAQHIDRQPSQHQEILRGGGGGFRGGGGGVRGGGFRR
ncbi:hypothetical protein D3C87_145860 [compost metagenome]